MLRMTKLKKRNLSLQQIPFQSNKKSKIGFYKKPKKINLSLLSFVLKQPLLHQIKRIFSLYIQQHFSYILLSKYYFV
ncbi:hypothetical protein THALO_250184 [Tenacibaculum halocynthiae]